MNIDEVFQAIEHHDFIVFDFLLICFLVAALDVRHDAAVSILEVNPGIIAGFDVDLVEQTGSVKLNGQVLQYFIYLSLRAVRLTHNK